MRFIISMEGKSLKDQLALLKLRNTCPAFDFDAGASFDLTGPGRLTVRWRKNGKEAALTADLNTLAFTAEGDTAEGKFIYTQK